MLISYPQRDQTREHTTTTEFNFLTFGQLQNLAQSYLVH